MPDQRLHVRPAVPTDTGPWTPAVVMFWQVVTAVTGLGLVLTWYSVSGKSFFDDQRHGINIAILVLVVSCAFHAMFILAGRRAVGLRREALITSAPVARSRGAVPALGSEVAALVAGEGLTRYHRATCTFARGRDWPVAPLAEHQAAGRTACGVCSP